MLLNPPSWANMNTVSCIPSGVGGGLSHRGLGGSVNHQSVVLPPQSPTLDWQMHDEQCVKQEIMDTDNRAENDSGISSTCTTESERFPSVSPGTSDQSSRDSNPLSQFSSPNGSDMKSTTFFSTPVSSSPFFPNFVFQPVSSQNTAQFSNLPNFEQVNAPKILPQAPLSISPNLTDALELNEPSASNLIQSTSSQFSIKQNETPMNIPKIEDDNESVEDKEEANKTLSEADEEISKPRVNSHGKVKLHKCKHCSFVGITKLEFWEHSAIHIKVEKRLDCPKCPFVTEYKHHLEYHLRNHFGSKPFACSKCKYTCVNKSMLNSHMKSHSEVYQYGCANCSYVTKYCHSLKLHLRKYDHEPAVVLNPDGTPNPLPIIDIYGTRRGPKQRPVASSVPEPTPTESSPPTTVSTPPANVSSPPSFYPNDLMMQGPQFPLLPMPYQLGTILNALQRMQNPLMFQSFNNEVFPNVLHTEPGSLIGNSTPPYRLVPPNGGAVVNENPEPVQREETSDENNLEALDLTSRSDSNITLSSSPASSPSSSGTQSPPPPSSPSASRNRRKGRAYKLGQAELQRQHESKSDDDNDDVDNQPPQKVSRLDSKPSTSTANSTIVAKTTEETTSVSHPRLYNCAYCDIDFKDDVLYAMHMGFHGFNDPFTCNGCGEQTESKIGFFLHLARVKHD